MFAWLAVVPASVAALAETGEVIVQFRDTATERQAERALELGALRVRKHLQTAAMRREGRRHAGLTVAASVFGVPESLRRLRSDPAVLHAEPNFRYRIGATANDPFFTAGNQWGLYGATTNPTNLFGSGAAQAWQNGFVGTNSVYVAVIDEGVQIGHPDLRPNVWTNIFDPADGLDNDGNGYVDDLHGWDFHNETNKVFVAGVDGHGTHVAGTIGARGGDLTGVAGMNWNVTLITGKFIVDGEGSSLDAIEAIDYMVDLKERHGLNIVAINASWGGEGYSRFLHEAVIRAAKAGILFVAAAGNNATNNDANAIYPANFATDVGTIGETAASYNAVISVAAIDKHGALASFSNYGAAKVHLGAPGVEVLSVYPEAWAYMSGTSMAAPHVSGAVALYASTHPAASAPQIRAALLGAVTPTASLSGKTSTGGRLNIAQVINPPLPAAPEGLAVAVQDAALALSWNPVPGALSYVVKRALSAAGPFSVAASSVAGAAWLDTALSHHQTYFYTVAAQNFTGSGTETEMVSARAVTRAPNAPAGLATAAHTNEIVLTWLPTASAQSHAVARGSSAAGPFAVIAPGVVGTNFVDSSVSPGDLHFYVVAASNVSGESAASPAVPARVLPAPAGEHPPVDLDGDGFTDLEEFYLGTNPAHPGSTLRFASSEARQTEIQLGIEAIPGREYVVEFNDNFPAGAWQEGARFVAAQTAETFADDFSAGALRRIYRVRAADYLPAKASEPAGFIRATFVGNSDTLLSVPFTRAPAALGTVAAVEPDRVQIDSGESWPPNRWVRGGAQTNTYYLHVRTGARAGDWHTIIASDAGSVTLDLAGDSLDGLAPGDAVAIVPHWSLGSLFPAGRGVHASARAGSRTTEIYFPKLDNTDVNPAPASTYYFRNGEWKMVGTGLQNHNDVVVPPDRFLFVRHNTNAATEAILHGAVLTGPWRLKVSRLATGLVDNLLALPRPLAVSLNDSGLIESGAFRASATAGSRVDELYVFDNTAAVINKSPVATYYYRFGAWRKVGAGLADAGDDEVFQPGSGFFIRTSPADTPARWVNEPSY